MFDSDRHEQQCKAPESFWKKLKQTLDEWKQELSKILTGFQQKVCTDSNLTKFLETHAKTMEDARKIFSPTLKGKSGAYHVKIIVVNNLMTIYSCQSFSLDLYAVIQMLRSTCNSLRRKFKRTENNMLQSCARSLLSKL